MTGTGGPGHLLTDRLDLRAMTSGDVAALHPSCWGRGYATELARAAQREAAAAEPDLPVVAWIHEQNASSQAVARHLGLSDFGQLKPQHWDGHPCTAGPTGNPHQARTRPQASLGRSRHGELDRRWQVLTSGGCAGRRRPGW
jgi:Acetyltransferase (GNAT) domain